jgi:cell division protein FtsB|tara:strand:- start:294 stop:449 length:156 start_codon:yes stop_codon:yes gene_type:complete
MPEGNTGSSAKMIFNTDLASKIQQDQDRASIEQLRSELEALKTRVQTLEDA